MKKIITLIIGFDMMLSFVGCASKTNNTTSSMDNTPPPTIPSNTTPATTPTEDDELMNKTIELKIDNTLVDVYWLDNDSVKELKKLAKDGLTINMHMYSTFE